MSARKGPERSKEARRGHAAARGEPLAARRRGAGGRRGLVAGAIAAVVIAGLAAWWMRARHAPAGAGDRLAGLSVPALADSANAYRIQDLSVEAIPFLQRIEPLLPQDDPEFHGYFAATLNNAAIQTRVRVGLLVPATRSTLERVALARESLHEFDKAIALSSDPEQQSVLITARAQMFAVWGFMRDAYGDYRHANSVHALDDKARRDAAWVEALLDDPTRPDAALMSSRDPAALRAALQRRPGMQPAPGPKRAGR